MVRIPGFHCKVTEIQDAQHSPPPKKTMFTLEDWENTDMFKKNKDKPSIIPSCRGKHGYHFDKASARPLLSQKWNNNLHYH